MQRPTSVTVFGTLNIVFGGFGLLQTALQVVVIIVTSWRRADEDAIYLGTIVNLPRIVGLLLLSANLVGSCMELCSGVGLLRMRAWSRKLAIAYAVFALVSLAVGAVITYLFILGPMTERLAARNGDSTFLSVMIASSVIGICAGAVYPSLLWYFMMRRNVSWALGGSSHSAVEAEAIAPSSVAPSANPYASPGVRYEPPVAEAVGSAESVVETFIPSKNGPALASYYLGLFSLFPAFGFFLGVAAVYYGIKGLRRVRENPAVRGGAHAWVGLICGVLFGLFNFALLALIVVGLIATLARPR